MTIAYVDTSFVLAILFAEPRARALRALLARQDGVFASDLLLAEAFSAAAREGIEPAAVAGAVRPISLVLPDRSLGPEVREALAHGYLRGADLWHVACAMFVAGDARAEVRFLSRDAAQKAVARRIGFRVA